jgi:hypothetical protein
MKGFVKESFCGWNRLTGQNPGTPRNNLIMMAGMFSITN